jgi:hypothetical protein
VHFLRPIVSGLRLAQAPSRALGSLTEFQVAYGVCGRTECVVSRVRACNKPERDRERIREREGEGGVDGEDRGDRRVRERRA